MSGTPVVSNLISHRFQGGWRPLQLCPATRPPGYGLPQGSVQGLAVRLPTGGHPDCCLIPDSSGDHTE